MNKGDNICKKCFEERKKSASNYHEEYGAMYNKIHPILFPHSYLTSYMFPTSISLLFNASAFGINYLYRKMKYGGTHGILYHIYINGYHEKWTSHHEDDSNLIKCCKCNIFNNDYFNLYSIE